MSSRACHHLLNTLDNRGISVRPDNVAQLFDTNETAGEAAAWVTEYLSAHSLLTKEELHFFEQNRSPIAKRGPTTGKPLDDVDLEAAICSLEASTAAIEKQCRMLEIQKKAIEDLRGRQSSEHSEERTLSRRKGLIHEKAQLEFDFNELSGSLTSRLESQLKQSNTAVSGVASTIERALDKDDRLLDGLQKLLPKLSAGESDGHTMADVDQLCQALIKLSGREIRARIDAAFEQGVSSWHNRLTHTHRDDPQAVKQSESLRAELEELSSEIDGLLAIAVENQYRVPIARTMEIASTETERDKTQWGEYVLSTLQYLSARLEVLDEYCQQLHAHQGAVKQVSASVDAVTAVMNNTNGDVPPSLRSPATPIARGLKPLRLVQANLAEPQDPATQLLRTFDIRVSDPTDTAKLATLLTRVDLERRIRLSDLAMTTERGMSAQLAETTAKAEADVQNLLSAIYSHSDFGDVRLVDSEVQAAMDGLEDQTQTLGEGMRKLDVERIGKVVKARQLQVVS